MFRKRYDLCVQPNKYRLYLPCSDIVPTTTTPWSATTSSEWPATTSEGFGDPFMITIDTTKAGSAADTFVLPITAISGDYYVDWGDGGAEETFTTIGNKSHTYAAQGIYQVSVSGGMTALAFNNIGDKLKLITIDAWGEIEWSSMENAFYGCFNMNGAWSDSPDLSNATSLMQVFRACIKFNYSVAAFNTSTIQNMGGAFYSCIIFNQSVSNFDTSLVTDMSNMFANCYVFNQSVANFNTSNVLNMSGLFSNCFVFNQSVANFDTSDVTDMSFMFSGCHAFNQSVVNFDTVNVINMSGMFTQCYVFNQPVINFGTANVTNMYLMFGNCYVFNQSVANFDTTEVINMGSMFFNCYVFNQSIANFNTSKVTDMSLMFYGASIFNQSLNNFDTSKVTNMFRMFSLANAFKQSLSTFDLSSIVDGASGGVREFLNNIDINAPATSTNYDDTLIAWAAADVPNSLTFHGGNSKYGDTGAVARASLVADDLWTITVDGGHI
jgi:surface protein